MPAGRGSDARDVVVTATTECRERPASEAADQIDPKGRCACGQSRIRRSCRVAMRSKRGQDLFVFVQKVEPHIYEASPGRFDRPHRPIAEMW